MEMKKALTTSSKPNGKEVEMMKKVGILVVALALVLVWGGMFSSASAQLLVGQENVLFFNNFENIYDADGNYKEPGVNNPLEVGDHFFGIINVQNIDAGGGTHWFSGPTDQITGIFAQEVVDILNLPGDSDPLDPTGTQTLPHIVLGPASVTTFSGPDGTSVDISGLLSGDEIIALWHDTGATTFESNGTIAQDVSVATDGDLWLTLGYSGLEAIGDPQDFTNDDGYFYSHSAFFVPLINFTGETWAGLNAIQNFTGSGFAAINDPNELEMDLAICGFAGCLQTDGHLSGELEGNPAVLLADGTITHEFSPWDFRSNDPAHLLPIPEPSTMLLFGMGLLGLGAYGRKRMKK
jgi:hypothetical protein